MRTAAAIAVVLLGFRAAADAAPPPLEAFARMPMLIDVAISPDGRYISWLQADGDERALVVLDRQRSGAARPILASKKEVFDIRWCSWANAKRLLCGFRAIVNRRDTLYPITRLVGVDADGRHIKVLMQNSRAGGSQFQDAVLDWTPQDPDTVLVAGNDSDWKPPDAALQFAGSYVHRYPSVFELDINTGALRQKLSEHAPISDFVSDGHGNIRAGAGVSDTSFVYFARLANESTWHELARFQAETTPEHPLEPIAVADDPNLIYAIGSSDGRDALWLADLTDREAPRIVFAHPQVDVERALFTKDRRLIGVYYEIDRPFVYYTDTHFREIIAAVNRVLPASFNEIEDATDDDSAFVIRARSDVDAGTYYLYDSKAHQLTKIGTTYPELDPQTLAHLRTIAYAARDGTQVPGYLLTPPGVRAERLPLVVMPHGGPDARDSWSFNFLQQFLASRGYAVLMMNFRGSTGYGNAWHWAGHADWGGVTYHDITDGALWAVRQGIADPRRTCIVGWSHGGYAALLGAVRNSDLYRCSISIAGVSDLTELTVDRKKYEQAEIARRWIGTDPDKLRADSPRRHADAVSIPILMIHGDRDFQAELDQSKLMAKALQKAGKPYRLVVIEDASHQMDRRSDRIQLLTEIEKFLATNLGPGVSSPAPSQPAPSP